MLLKENEDPPELDPRRALEFLPGVWRDEVRGSTIYIVARGYYPMTVYCYGGDHELTGDFRYWEYRRGQFYAKFQWRRQPIAGIFVLQPESPDRMVGGWWYDRDVKGHPPSQLPFLPGINPANWVRQDPRRPWPTWATTALRLPTDGSVTSESLAAASERTALQPDARTAAGRYDQRLVRWTAGREGLARWAARAEHRAWWLAHNLVVHPLLALVQARWAVALHDWTSRRLNLDAEQQPSPPPQVERRFWWLVHNLAAHPAIGLAPCPTTFAWHDATARRMRVANWA